ncbi:phosphoribosyltransferase [Thermincola potens]|uniref:Phosphoribosyltransferase n=1 Tax=Thermincola potens (strain JR) TaxID=635013 RepID=D5XDS9_THEPJ|nr:phosphoribosyltransferase [Thermincola potens]ADG83825.1 phosphoribosyltransferase [Thermincola potens JR]
MRYRDRQEAGKQLAELLKDYKNEDCIILGIPRGGVIVAAEVAEALHAPLDIIIPRKIGAPFNPEVAIGAITQDGTMICEERLISMLGISEQELAEEAGLVREEISRRMERYRGQRPFPELSNKTVILVDDGIATGYTVRAAIKSINGRNPGKLILAVPVAPKDTLLSLANELDEMVCPLTPDDFYAVGQYYMVFDQVTDHEVMRALREAALNSK